MINIKERLDLLRSEMLAKKIDMYLIPSIDAHNSEYVPLSWQRRPWISGFDGSAGEVLVTMDHAYLSTDGRYFLQANLQLDPEYYTLIKQTGFLSAIENWLCKNASNKRIGFDPSLVGISRAKRLQQTMQRIGGEAVMINDNLVDSSRNKLGEEFSLPKSKVYTIDPVYTGDTLIEKLTWLQNELNVKGADYIVLNVLDEIAWLFNLRGNDIDYNPVFISYALIGHNEVVLFIDHDKIVPEVDAYLAKAQVKIASYESFFTKLADLKGIIWLDDKTASAWMEKSISSSSEIIYEHSPIIYRKAIKNDCEVSGAKVAHIKDAIAVINFLYWLDNNWQTGVDEIQAMEKLAGFREAQANFKGPSFSTISGYASNGAIIHYRSTSETAKVIKNDNLYLVDSGGQYLEGTTDITRTVHLGIPLQEHKHHYTLVLKGHLALGGAIFVHGTCGEHLDALARSPLWREYLNYRHGTGHGVGSFLCVHEGPQKISQANSNVSLEPGMIVSNEPGLYIDGSHGIRIENLCLVSHVENELALASEYGPFYRFEDLTLVPYCKKLIDIKLLSDEEKKQVSEYYAKIRKTVMPLLDPQIQDWLSSELDLF